MSLVVVLLARAAFQKAKLKTMARISKRQRQSQRKRVSDVLYTYALFSALFLISLRGIYWSVTDSWWGYQSQRWPSVTGIVVSDYPSVSYNKGTKMYAPEVIYKYQVAGAWYRNNVYSFPTGRTSSLNEVNNQLAAYPKGLNAKVFYNPSNPQISCLVAGYSLGFTLFFLPFSIVLAALSIWGIIAVSKR